MEDMCILCMERPESYDDECPGGGHRLDGLKNHVKVVEILKEDLGYRCGLCDQFSEVYEGFWHEMFMDEDMERVGFEYTCTKDDDIDCRACGNSWHMDCTLFEVGHDR